MGFMPIMMGVMAAGTAITAYGQYQQGQAQAKASRYQSDEALQNAKVAAQNAQITSEQGAAQVLASGIKNREQIGAIQANEGASGVNVNSGSNVEVKQSAHELATLDALNVRSEATKRAYGYLTEQNSFEAQSKLDTMAASAAKTSSILSATGTLLSGAGNAGTAWQKYQLGSGVGASS